MLEKLFEISSKLKAIIDFIDQTERYELLEIPHLQISTAKKQKNKQRKIHIVYSGAIYGILRLRLEPEQYKNNIKL